MRKLILIILLTCSISPLAPSYTWNQPSKLSKEESSLDVELAFLENVIGLIGTFNYGVYKGNSGFFRGTYSGFLSGGVKFEDEIPLLSNLGISIPPAPMFIIGIKGIEDLGRTGIDFWGTVMFGASFTKAVDDYTKETIMTMRVLEWRVSWGLMKEIPTESGFRFIPSVGVTNSVAWTTADFLNQDHMSESSELWSGQIGLEIGLSPKISVGGVFFFSFEESNFGYSLSLSHRL